MAWLGESLLFPGGKLPEICLIAPLAVLKYTARPIGARPTRLADSGAIWEDIQMMATTPNGWFALAAGRSQRLGRANRTMQYVVLLDWYT